MQVKGQALFSLNTIQLSDLLLRKSTCSEVFCLRDANEQIPGKALVAGD